jgi:hypothetical protein
MSSTTIITQDASDEHQENYFSHLTRQMHGPNALIACCSGTNIQIYSLHDLVLRYTIPYKNTVFDNIVFLSKTELLITMETCFHIWELPTLIQTKAIENPLRPPYACFHVTRKKFLYFDATMSFCIFDRKTETARTIKNSSCLLLISPISEQEFATYDLDQNITIWNYDGLLLKVLRLKGLDPYTIEPYSEDLLLSTSPTEIQITNWKTDELIRTIEAPYDSLWIAQKITNELIVFSARVNGLFQIVLYNLETRTHTLLYETHHFVYKPVARFKNFLVFVDSKKLCSFNLLTMKIENSIQGTFPSDVSISVI